MRSFAFEKNGLCGFIRHPLIVGSIVAALTAGCATSPQSSGSSGAKGDSSLKAPRLVKKDSAVVWSGQELFGPVPAELAASGNEACNAAGGGKRMKAAGFHPQAARLDGSVFPKGGFLCVVDDSPAAPAVVTAAPAPAAPKAEAAPKPAGPAIGDLPGRTQDWAKSWASKDLNAYFAFYSSNFKPNGFASTGAWKEARTARINKPGSIAVEVSDITTKPLSGGAVETRFTQRYTSSNFKDSSTKALIWANEGGQWKIVSESNR